MFNLPADIWWLFAGRLVAGVMGASFTTANAYIADVSTDETRARNFGFVGMMFGLGFSIGPVLGGLLGEMLERQAGPHVFEDVEHIRKLGKSLRELSSEEEQSALDHLFGAVMAIPPDRVGEVARITTAIARAGGYLSVFVAYPASSDMRIWAAVCKVTGIPRDELVAVIEGLGDAEIEDIREI